MGMFKLPQEKEDIMNTVGTFLCSTVHQHQMLTIVCPLAEAASDLLGAMNMQFSIHEELIYVPSYRRVVYLIHPAQRTDVSFKGVVHLSRNHMPFLYSGVTTVSNFKIKTVGISSEIMQI